MSFEIPAEHMEMDNKHGTWTLQPETLSGFLESEGLSTPQIESIPMIIGNSYGIDRLPMSPSPDYIGRGSLNNKLIPCSQQQLQKIFVLAKLGQIPSIHNGSTSSPWPNYSRADKISP
jgi:hypothetical protein